MVGIKTYICLPCEVKKRTSMRTANDRRLSTSTTFSLNKGPNSSHNAALSNHVVPDERQITDAETQADSRKNRNKGKLPIPVVPQAEDPEKKYECVQEILPGSGRNFCFASIRPGLKDSYRIVTVRKSPIKAVFKMEKPSPYALNVLEAFQWDGFLYTVYDRLGVTLDAVVLIKGARLEHMHTICREVSKQRS
jgi:hypothetical protein